MSEFIIRPCRPSDAEGIHALRVMEGVRENILALPSERLGFCEAYLNGLGPDDHQFAAAVPLPATSSPPPPAPPRPWARSSPS